ncbi:hypothetical protein [Brevibacillus choshinensis]|uniref:hypothetical protein n=1 Tax=Brevibacillus choshinensis TaxID=54911 RepID=UPI002E228F78|nr:hypothetical protein [Brevibacillus choshinensis]
MRARDKEILADLERFRCLSRDDIVAIHFARNKASVKACNVVMRRLRDRGEVELVTSSAPYVYAGKPSPLRKDSQKIPHYLAIAAVYREMLRIIKPRLFQVEPKYGKGMPEPDIFTIWNGRAFWIEVQRNMFSEKMWEEKWDRYLEMYRSDKWRGESWQPSGERKVFPFVWVLSATRVSTPDGLPFPILQSRSVDELFKPASA